MCMYTFRAFLSHTVTDCKNIYEQKHELTHSLSPFNLSAKWFLAVSMLYCPVCFTLSILCSKSNLLSWTPTIPHPPLYLSCIGLSTCWWCSRKSQGITKISMIRPLGIMKVCTTFHGNPKLLRYCILNLDPSSGSTDRPD